MFLQTEIQGKEKPKHNPFKKLFQEYEEPLFTSLVKIINNRANISLKHDTGVLCFMFNRIIGAYFLELFSLEEKRLVWKHEAHKFLFCRTSKNLLQVFEGRTFVVVDFVFYNEEEVNCFLNTFLRKPCTESTNNNNHTGESVTSISKPMNFNHVKHIGLNQNKDWAGRNEEISKLHKVNVMYTKDAERKSLVESFKRESSVQKSKKKNRAPAPPKFQDISGNSIEILKPDTKISSIESDASSIKQNPSPIKDSWQKNNTNMSEELKEERSNHASSTDLKQEEHTSTLQKNQQSCMEQMLPDHNCEPILRKKGESSQKIKKDFTEELKKRQSVRNSVTNLIKLRETSESQSEIVEAKNARDSIKSLKNEPTRPKPSEQLQVNEDTEKVFNASSTPPTPPPPPPPMPTQQSIKSHSTSLACYQNDEPADVASVKGGFTVEISEARNALLNDIRKGITLKPFKNNSSISRSTMMDSLIDAIQKRYNAWNTSDNEEEWSTDV